MKPLAAFALSGISAIASHTAHNQLMAALWMFNSITGAALALWSWIQERRVERTIKRMFEEIEADQAAQAALPPAPLALPPGPPRDYDPSVDNNEAFDAEVAP